jgi:Protein of unknown function (DUF4238)
MHTILTARPKPRGIASFFSVLAMSNARWNTHNLLAVGNIVATIAKSLVDSTDMVEPPPLLRSRPSSSPDCAPVPVVFAQAELALDPALSIVGNRLVSSNPIAPPITLSTPRDHHFVPKLLLRPWLVQSPDGQRELLGYWWDCRGQKLTIKRKGLDAFCVQLDLLTLKNHHLGRDAIERVFFGDVDTKGAIARGILLEQGPNRLTEVQRCDFARLLLSLDARRPENVKRLRTQAASDLAASLDASPEVGAALAEHGIAEDPSAYAEVELGWDFEDRALAVIQRLVNNPKVGGRLINAYWTVRRLGRHDGSLVLADRPLIRIHGYESPGATWVLPLTPHAVFIACAHQHNCKRLMNLSDSRFVKEANTSSAAQADRFVFCTDTSHGTWLEKHLKPRR